MKTRFSAFGLANGFLLALIGLATLLPMLNLASKALSSEGYVIAGKVAFWPKGFQLDTIKYVMGLPEFYRSFFISVTVTLLGTFFAMLLTVTTAYPLSKPWLKGRRLFMLLMIIAMLFNAGMVPNYMLYRFLGLTNTVFALVFSGMFSVFNMLIVKSWFESLPESVEEAAKIDGASDLRILFGIVLPMSGPVIATVTLFYAVGYWGNYFSGVLYITDPGLRPLQQYIYDLITVSAMQDATGTAGAITNISGENVRSATILLSVLPILVAYPYLQKYFVKGVTLGAVKE